MCVIVLIGVAGAGKTTVGRRLAELLAWPFLDGDALHTPANIAKMQAGVPLGEIDRAPWLTALRDRVAHYRAADRPLVLACSALRQAHRSALKLDAGVRFVYLKAEPELLAQRLSQRAGHFFPPSLLRSQYQALQEPTDAIVVDASKPIDSIVREIRAALEL